MVKNMVALELPSVFMMLDSGADVSVAPGAFYQLGQPGEGRAIQMSDAQGEPLPSGACKSSSQSM